MFFVTSPKKLSLISNLNKFTNPFEDKDENKNWYGPEFFIFFYTSEYGIHQQETHKINRDIQGVFGLSIPSIYFIISKSNSNSSSSLTEKKFQFFEGLEKKKSLYKNNKYNI